MIQTKNNMPEKMRTTAIGLLQPRLAIGIDLMMQAKQAHWNVRGPNFIALHELFDKIHNDISASVDLLAERIVQLGGIAEGTCMAAVRSSILPEYPLLTTHEADHVHKIATALASYGETIRDGIYESDRLRDQGTADILTEILRVVDQDLWFVEAHSHERKAHAMTGAA